MGWIKVRCDPKQKSCRCTLMDEKWHFNWISTDHFILFVSVRGIFFTNMSVIFDAFTGSSQLYNKGKKHCHYSAFWKGQSWALQSKDVSWVSSCWFYNDSTPGTRTQQNNRLGLNLYVLCLLMTVWGSHYKARQKFHKETIKRIFNL